jgi:hypothetical protein
MNSFEALAMGFPSRHLLPIVQNGNVLCEGSPSRNQYLEGMPRDKRPGTQSYNAFAESSIRRAYARIVEAGVEEDLGIQHLRAVNENDTLCGIHSLNTLMGRIFGDLPEHEQCQRCLRVLALL